MNISQSRNSSSFKNLVLKGGKFAFSVIATLVAVLLLATGLIAIVVWLFGSLDAYQQWSKTHELVLAAWRILLYTALICLWLPTRRKLAVIEGGNARLRRCEIMSVATIGIYELQHALAQ